MYKKKRKTVDKPTKKHIIMDKETEILFIILILFIATSAIVVVELHGNLLVFLL